jgi:uncharacterized protein (TIGR02466 family)
MFTEDLIWEVDLSDFNKLCLEVIDTSETGKYSLINGVSSYNTNREFLFHPALKDLVREIQLTINEYVLQFEDLEPTVISASWFNVLGNSGVVEKHKHVDSWLNTKGSVVSGAYYPHVEVGSVPLIFDFPDKRKLSIKDTQYDTIPFSVESKSGNLILFPSWLPHWTEPNETSERITVSFNSIRKSVYLEERK